MCLLIETGSLVSDVAQAVTCDVFYVLTHKWFSHLIPPTFENNYIFW